MNLVRPFLIVALVLGAIVFATLHTPHHASPSPFLTLYGHLVPSTLVQDSHAASGSPALFALDAPFLPPAMDSDPATSGVQIALTNLQVFQICAMLLLVVCFSGVPSYLKTGKGDYVSRLFAGFAMWVRDEMVYPVMGKEMGRKFLPYFLTIFFFVMFMNVLGLLPGSATATASIFVTAGLALTTFLVMFFGGMIAQGPFAYWKNLVPHVPWFVWPIMFIVELVGILVKPFALMIRLFANMTAGHMVVLSFMGLLFMIASLAGNAAAWASSPVLVGFAVFIMIIESFVALLQAYVFTMLSILFIQASIHPEH